MSFWVIYCLFSPLTFRKIKILKLKKASGHIIILHNCTINDNHMMFLRYGAWQTELFVIMDCFLPFYPPMDPENQNFEKMNKNTWRYFHFTKVYHKWQSYDLCFLRYGVQQTEFFAILDRFLPFYPSNNQKIQNFEKMKKIPGAVIILHSCIINDNHMMYGSWDIKRDGQNFLLFWTMFCSFTPLTTWKIKILKKWKKRLGILSFYTGVP